MIRKGIYEGTIERNEKEIPIVVDWTLEVSSYGDGSEDRDFDYQAYYADSREELDLTEDEEEEIYSSLEDSGEFA